jgi:phosphate transport system permease protein
MTDKLPDFATRTPALKRRHRAEARFRWMGRSAIILALGFLVVMVGSIGWMGAGAFRQTQIQLSVHLEPEEFAGIAAKDANYNKLIKSALRARFPEVKKRKEKRKLYDLVSTAADSALRDLVLEDPAVIGGDVTLWVIASDEVDLLVKHGKSSGLKDTEREWVSALQDAGEVRVVFNRNFFLSGDSREPELAGIASAFVGTAFTLAVCFAISFPIGIFAAIYLEEFTKRGRWSDFIEVNINNLAAVPSIVFGLLGLAIFLSVFGMPRSSPLVGGLVLALMTLPTIIIASRAALRAVPPAIREAALGIGATRIQTVFHHVAPLALPGMLTGAIVGMARALGETAPLLMIGMVAFIVDIPKSILEPATALPVQIFLWADSPERAFLEKTSAAIIVLIAFLVVMNLLAILLRIKYRQRF